MGIGTASPGAKLDVVGGLVRVGGQLLADASTDNLLVNGDFEMGSADGWTGIGTVIAAGASSRAGNFVSQLTGSSQVESVDFIPVDPVRDILQLE